jgi:Sulfotransferase family
MPKAMRLSFDAAKPVPRAIQKRSLYWAARVRAGIPMSTTRPAGEAPAFVIGCGRSGTTVLGKALGLNPAVRYLNEPFHLWAAVSPLTDVTNRFHLGEARCILTGAHVDDKVRDRFSRLFLASSGSSKQLLLEKSPANTMRIDFLRALAPEARFVHIVRDGLEVVKSIARLATSNAYQIAWLPNFSQWWGTNGIKWAILARDGKEAGYFAGEVDGLRTHEQRGAYEWLVSLGEVDRWRSAAGDRLLELTYTDLVREPGDQLARVGEFLHLPISDEWTRAASSMITPVRTPEHGSVDLPPAMMAAFNERQEELAFPGRARAQA